MLRERLISNLQLIIFLSYIWLVTFQPSLQLFPENIIWFHDRQRLIELFLITVLLSFALLNPFARENSVYFDKKIQYLFFCLVLASVFSSLMAVSKRHAFTEISIFAGLSFLAIYISQLYLKYKEYFIKNLCYTLWASILLYMVSFYSGYITATVFNTPLKWPFPFTGFSNIRAFNQYQLWTIGVLSLPLVAFRFESNLRLRLLYVALTLWWVLLFYSASRGVIVAWAIGTVITLAIYRKLAWPFLKLQFFQFSTGYIAYYVLFKIIPSVNQSTLITNTVIRETTNDRLELWKLAFILIEKFPLFGTGPMGYAWYSKTNAHPHNSLLQIAAEWGLIATFIILTIAGYSTYQWLRKLGSANLAKESELTKHLTVILFFTIITNAAYSLVDGVIVMPISQVLMFTIIGTMLGLYASISKATTIKCSRFRPVFAGVVLFTMLWSIYPEISRGLSGYEKGFSIGYPAAGPRFWREVQ
jgi:putative inorganic carbon (hco3(-)) transporter